VGFSSQIPVFLLAAIGGITADRRDRRRIILATQTSSMVLIGILAAITLSGAVHVWHVMTIAALLGVVNAFDIPARQAFLVDMVGKEDLMNAIALNSSMFNSARVIGPGVAGLLVALFGEGWCFLLNSISYLAVITGLLMMRVTRSSPPAEQGSPLLRIAQGFRFAWAALPVRHILLLVGLVSALGMPYTVLMPIFADQIFQRGASGLGILMSCTGIGALCGALFLATRSNVRGLGRWVAIAAGGFGVSMAVFAYSPYFWLAAAALIPTGGFMMLQMASSNTLLQAMVPDHLRGRVMALYSMMFMGMAPLGALFAGAAAHHLGAPLTVAIGGGACLGGGVIFGATLPVIRSEARALIVAQGLSGGEPPQEMIGGVVPVTQQRAGDDE
jgi:MFS family permease